MSNNAQHKALLSALGFSARAGAIIFGVPLICEALSSKKKVKGKYPLLVVEASDSSENTHKRISDRCSFYGVKHVRIEATSEELSSALGKNAPIAAVALTDENLCRLAQKQLNDQ